MKPEHCQWTDEIYPNVILCKEDCEKGCSKRETIADMIADINRQKKGVWLSECVESTRTYKPTPEQQKRMDEAMKKVNKVLEKAFK